MDPIELTVTASSILFGFLFAGFWWAIDRELKFEPNKRHFKLGYLLLLITMAVLAFFGILRPLKAVAAGQSLPSNTFLGITMAIVGVFGYMLTEFGHYSVFQRPKYTTGLEHVFFWSTLVALVILAIAVLR